MPGSPATSPRVGAPRYSDADVVSFASQVNAIVDAFDAAVALLGQTEANVATKNANYTAAAGDLVLATAAITVTLPNAPAAGSSVLVVAEGGAVTINRGGTDTITNYSSSGNTTLAVPQGTLTRLRYLSGAWHVTQAAQITDAGVATANKDGADGTPSMRTLGVTAGKAVGGDRVGWQGVAKNAAFTAVVGQMNYVTGAQTCTLPTSPADDTEAGVVSLTGTVTVNRGGTNTIEEYGVTTKTSTMIPAGTMIVYKYLSGVWYRVRDTRSFAQMTDATAHSVSTAAITQNTTTAIPVSVADDDPWSLMDTANHWYVVPYAGRYDVVGHFYGTTTAVDQVANVSILKNGTSVLEGSEVVESTGHDLRALVSGKLKCAAGDHIQAACFCTGPSAAFGNSADSNYLHVAGIGPGT